MAQLYCLDANVLIEAWNSYYSPRLCPSYWDMLAELGTSGRIFLPHAVGIEITRTQDALADWVKDKRIPIRANTEGAGRALRNIYAADEKHLRLVDSTKNRSVADPWVIAHAMDTGATVVTKEKATQETGSKRIRVPDVCHTMAVPCITDFAFLNEMAVRFTCER